MTHGRGTFEVHFVACGACSAHIGATRARSTLLELAKGRSDVVTQAPSGICHFREAVTGVARFTHSHCIPRETTTGTSVHARTPSSSEGVLGTRSTRAVESFGRRQPGLYGPRTVVCVLGQERTGQWFMHGGRLLRETTTGTRVCARSPDSSEESERNQVHARWSNPSGDDDHAWQLGPSGQGHQDHRFTQGHQTPRCLVTKDLGSRRMLRPSGKSNQNHGSRMDAATFGRR